MKKQEQVYKALMVKPDTHFKVVVEAKKNLLTVDELVKKMFEALKEKIK